MIILTVMLYACSQVSTADGNRTSILPSPSPSHLSLEPDPTLSMPTASLHTIGPTPQSATCPEILGEVVFPFPSSLDGIVAQIFEYLNSGGDPNALEALFMHQEDSGLYILLMDLNQDDIDELIIAGPYVSSASPYGSASVTILQCTEGHYDQAYSSFVGDISFGYFLNSFDFPPETGNDLIFISKDIRRGMHYLVVGWDGSEFITLLQDTALFSDIVVYDRNDDEIFEIDLIGTVHASSSGGPIRDEIRRYEWTGETYERFETDFLPSTSRVHLLEDAQRALERNDPALAAGLYQIAAENVLFYSNPSEYQISEGLEHLAEPYQRSFAAFRAAVLLYSLGCAPCAERSMSHIESWFAVGEPGGEFQEAYKVFVEEVQAGESYKNSCISSEIFLAENYRQVAGEQGHLGNWGWSTIQFGIDAICPDLQE
jgi:hypothetical protein